MLALAHNENNSRDQLVFHEKQFVADWVAREVEQTASWGDFYAMGIKGRDQQLVAGIVFNNFNGANATAHIAVKKFTRQLPYLIVHAIHYAFEVNGLNRLTGLVSSKNEKALRLNRHIGFEHEATMRKAGPDGEDLLVLVLWPENSSRWMDKL